MALPATSPKCQINDSSRAMMAGSSSCASSSPDTDPSTSPDTDCGLIMPKRLVPTVAPIMKDLHRELKFNQSIGRNVLDKKSELKKALEKHEDRMKLKQLEQDRLNRRTSLELRLEQRAEQLARSEPDDTEIYQDCGRKSLTIVENTKQRNEGSHRAPTPPVRNFEHRVTGDNNQQQSSNSEFLEVHAKLCQKAKSNLQWAHDGSTK